MNINSIIGLSEGEKVSWNINGQYWGFLSSGELPASFKWRDSYELSNILLQAENEAKKFRYQITNIKVI